MPIRTLSKDLQKKSEKELNEVPTRLHEDLRYIREWLEQQPHLHARTDDQWLLSFLRGCKFGLQRTKEKLDLFYTMRTMVPEFFANRDPLLPEIQELLKLGAALPLPKTADPAAPRIILVRCEPVDPSKIPFVTVIKMALMITDILLNEDDNYVIAGVQLISDFKGMSIHHALQVTPSLCKKGIVCAQQAYPSRPKSFHFISTPSIFQGVFNIIKTVATDKIVNRIHIYNENNLESLYNYIPSSILPKEYGGGGDSLEELTAYWKKKVESYRDWFLEDVQYCSNEKMRPEKPRTSEEFFGVHGSFRKLDFD